MAEKARLDVIVFERGLAPSRARAQALVMAGKVRVGGELVTKAGASDVLGTHVHWDRQEQVVVDLALVIGNELVLVGVDPLEEEVSLQFDLAIDQHIDQSGYAVQARFAFSRDALDADNLEAVGLPEIVEGVMRGNQHPLLR